LFDDGHGSLDAMGSDVLIDGRMGGSYAVINPPINTSPTKTRRMIPRVFRIIIIESFLGD
jgi:hypothetical protein